VCHRRRIHVVRRYTGPHKMQGSTCTCVRSIYPAHVSSSYDTHVSSSTQDARLYVYMCSVDAPERVRR
jgi:hypothetical protein